MTEVNYMQVVRSISFDRVDALEAVAEASQQVIAGWDLVAEAIHTLETALGVLESCDASEQEVPSELGVTTQTNNGDTFVVLLEGTVIL